MQKITDKLAALPPNSTYFSLEFFPPKTSAGTANLLPRIGRLAQLQPLYVAVTWGAGGSTESKSLELAEICQRQGLTTCLHLTCTNCSKTLLDKTLAEAKRIGVRNILALRGDEPREEEFRNGNGHVDDTEHNNHEPDAPQFRYAVDLVRYIRAHHGDYFCIGVAAYPEGHVSSSYPSAQSPALDLPHLVEKTQAGADFIMTQLFYDVDAFLAFEKLLRSHESGAFKDIPITPGLMPIQSWGILTRTAKLSCAKIPDAMRQRLEAVKADDEAVKKVGVDVIGELVDTIKEKLGQTTTTSKRPLGFHFYTLNLEKAVVQILEKCNLIPAEEPVDGSQTDNEDAIIIDREPATKGPSTTSDSNGSMLSAVNPVAEAQLLKQRRSSSFEPTGPHNRLVVSGPPAGKQETHEATSPRLKTIAISKGEGSLGREAVRDEFPNGRWGDASSPG